MIMPASERALTAIRHRIFWLVVLLLMAGLFHTTVEAATGKRYALILVSSLKGIHNEDLPDSDYLTRYHVYVSEYRKGDRLWYRLRLGFFDSVTEARKVLKLLQPRYGDPWIYTVSDREYKAALENRITAEAAGQPEVIEKSVTGPDVLLEQARRMLTRGEPREAIPLLRRILTLTQTAASQGKQPQQDMARDALELLGVAQERAGDNQGALASYREFIKRYPDSEAGERVRQRLVVLETATAKATGRLAKFREDEEGVIWSGSFSQFSNRDIRFLDNGDHEVSSTLFNDLDVSSRYRGRRVDVRSQFSGSYRYEFNADNTTEDQLRVSSLYIDLRDKRLNTAAVLGRQSASTGGVLGRFDGAWLSYRARPRWKYNLVAGFPVELSSSSTIDEMDRYFVGFNIDMGTFADVWDLNAFYIEQVINNVNDRQAVGGELRFSNQNQSHLLLLDYDVGYETLNSFLVVDNWFLPSSTTFNLVLDYRTVPVLTTRNALIGRLETDISAMLLTLTEDEVRQLARDRTAVSRSVTVGASHQFNAQYQINGDITVSNQTSQPASGGVAAVPATDNQYTYSLTLIGSSVIKNGDIVISSLRYQDITTAFISTVDLNMRYPLTKAWRAGPAFVVDYRDGKDGIDQMTYKPSFRIDYRWLNNITFDTEIALIYIDDMGSGLGSDTDLFFELGYRVDF